MSSIDWLSRLLTMIAVTGRLEVRHVYGAPWRLAFDQSLAHEIPYHVVLQGRVTVEDPEMASTRELVGGDIILWPHGSAHVLHGAHLDMLCGRFFIGLPHDRLIRNYLPRNLVVRAMGSDGEAGSGSASSRLGRLVGLMRMESAGDRPGGHAILNDLSSALFTLVLRAAASESLRAPVGLLALASDPRLAPAISAMFDEPHRPWNPLHLADLCSMSRTTFMRHFLDRAGRSAVELLTDFRMSLAANQLKKPAVTIKHVADSVGYRSVTAFRRVFANRMGMTPGQWRDVLTEAPRTKLVEKIGAALC